MERYQSKFLERMKETASKWKEDGVISHTAVIRFFHSVVGTGATIGLHEHAEAAKKHLEYVKKVEKENWTYDELEPLLVQFRQDTSKEEEQEKQRTHQPKPVKVDDTTPLILLIDDDHDFVDYMKRMLEKEGYVVLAALTAEKGLQLYINQRPDCVLLDYSIPGVDSFRLLGQLLSRARNEFIPIMMITAEMDKAIEQEAYRNGVMDYFTKPIQREDLLIRLKNRLDFRRVVQKSVMIDELTGAFSRKFLDIEAKRLIETYNRYQETFSVAMLDLDHFKQVNDRYGHLVGDKVLQEFVEFLNRSKRKLDMVFRLGGEEFLILFPHTSKAQAKSTLHRFLTDFHEMLFHEGESTFQMSFSAGLTEMKEKVDSIQVLMEEADQALYEAKGNGRNQVAIYNELSVKKMVSQVHIYVVDDDPIIRQVLTDNIQTIQVEGVEIKTTSYREGESFLQSNWYKPRERHLIILDRIMPRIDGLELVAKIREAYPEGKVVILMLTGRNNEKEIIRALDMGADDYVTKPFKLDELLARIKRLIHRTFM
ncbi:response regulator [Alkalihalobacillus sp. MEB130]|uniref:GGDEF domain-containing response regulator n=1 Tax=Alkalihalobacillus sp. MEB130 TaxID=2976704 RepID=UPI0028DE0A84|nr:response regulator [Alkalihalobacillus sp. MEB130]MDT8859864.1 response regulator [Alkalihalobacillus sp. MEB130]